LKEYSKDGTNKRINISAFSEEDEKEPKLDFSEEENESENVENDEEGAEK
jgi:hypothetical protein